MEYRANPAPNPGMAALLRSDELHSVLDDVGWRIRAWAVSAAPRDTGNYVSRLEVDDGGLVNIGRYPRTTVNVVAKAPYSAVIEARQQVLTRAVEAVANAS